MMHGYFVHALNQAFYAALPQFAGIMMIIPRTEVAAYHDFGHAYMAGGEL